MGRPKKEETDVVEATEEVTEVKTAKKEVKKTNRVEIADGIFVSLKEEGAGVLIECKAKDREKASQEAFAYLQGIMKGNVIIQGVCGCSIEIKNIERMPKNFNACGCGNPDHAFVLYKFI